MTKRAGRSVSPALLVAAATLVYATTAPAQALPQVRDGFTLSAGVGTGVASVQCSVCRSGPGTSAYARIGGALHRDLIVAGQVSTWRRSGDPVSESQSDVRVQLSAIDLIAQWYPHVERGFFVETGAGLGVLETRVSDRLTGVRYRTGLSAGYELGAGYDYRVKANLSITPYATFFGAAPAHMDAESGNVYGNALQIGLGLTKH